MAGKQLGKLRQWASEAVFTKEKTTVTDEFRELEHDIELRREGIQRLTISADDFHHALAKKKESEVIQQGEKLSAIDALGLVMIAHGEEFGEESAYGLSLTRFGRGQCKIATLQEAMALTFNDTFLASLKRYNDEITDYQAQRKKLESRRLSYDAAMSKVDTLRKNKKTKEKELTEAEDELERAKQRYEETSEDVRTRMYEIQENELNQLRDLTSFLDLQLNFYEQAVEVLRDVKEGWHDESNIAHVDRPRPTGPTHSFSRTVEPDSPRVSPKASSPKPAPKSPKLRSKRSQVLNSDSDGEQATNGSKPTSRKHSFSLGGRKNSTRKRSDSGATEKSGAATEREDGERAKDKGGKRMSMGWGMSWGSKSGGKSKEKFASLRGDRGSDAESDGDDDDDRRSAKSSKSNKSSKIGRSPKAPARLIRTASAASTERRRVRANFDYTAAADDELSFRAGDEINIVNETSDAWWTGELGGRQGLFPTSYVTPISALDARRPPMPPRRPSAPGSSPEDVGNGLRNNTSQHVASPSTDTDAAASDADQPFGDHMLVAHRTPVYANFDQHSFASSTAEDTESEAEERPVLQKRSPKVEEFIYTKPPAPPPVRPTLPSRPSANVATSSPSVSSVSVASSLGKKAPPPPPPRRASTYGTASLGGSAASTPPIPPRTLPPSISRGSSGASAPPPPSAQALAAAMAVPTESPFDSMTDLTESGVCKEFKQHPFKPRGMCANCFEQHG